MERLSKRKSVAHIDEPGHAHALTFSCFRGLPLLSKDRTRQWMLEAIDLARCMHEPALWAFVIMPEHVHLLIFPKTPSYRISAVLSTSKQPVAKRAIIYLKSQSPDYLTQLADRQPNGASSIRFWQRGGGYDRNLWSPRHIWETIDYIHNNPVRRGQVEGAVDWAWSSAAAYASGNATPLRIDFASLPDDPRRINAPS